MRKQYEKQLAALHTSLVHMGALCEDAIACATKALLEEDSELREKAVALEQQIDLAERDIEQQCVRLLLQQQPVAGDLRQITAAQRMIIDMERVGDQAADIAELSAFMVNSPVKSDIHIGDMARSTIRMVTDSVEAFVREDVDQAEAVIAYDDVVDGLFDKIKDELVGQIQADGSLAGNCLDLLMIAKYFERIGDHAVNIAEWVLYFMTGSRDGHTAEGQA